MSETVNTKAVEMRFDNRNFETNVKQSMSTLDKLKQSLKLKGASEGLKEVERSSKNLDFKDTGSALDKLGKKFSALETIATGVFLRIGMQAADAGMKFVKSFTVDQVAAGWGKYEEKTTAVQTIMANLKDDASKFVDEASKMRYVEGYLDKLMWFSDETSYSFTDMTGNVGKFIANGQGLEESVTAMQGIATWAAISGQNAQTASRAMYNISQAMGVGSMKIKDWMSIENANMATAQFKELAIAIGEEKGVIKKGAVTVESFRESLSGSGTKDWLNKDVMMEVFKTYGAAADRIQEYAKTHNVTSTEAIKEIKKQDEEFANSLGFKAFAAAQEAKTFSEVVSATADAVSTKWLRIFESIFGNYLEAKEMWTGLSEDLWDMFAGPLDQINTIMSKWKRGFLKNGPKTTIDIAYETGELDDIESKFSYITKEAAEQQVAIDADTYAIEKLEDGTERLVRTVKTASGEYTKSFKTIYNADQKVISGREMLISGFKNILDAFFHDTEDEDGHEILSVFGAIRKAFLEVFFPGDDESSLAKNLWDLTKKFQEFTEKLKPTQETIDKIKNAFKGFFTIFRIGKKFLEAIITPFKELFQKILGKNPGGTLLDFADDVGTWIQNLEKYLDENGVFEKVSDWIRNGIQFIADAFNWVSEKLSGMSFLDLLTSIKDKIKAFFEDFDFKGKFEKISNFFKGASGEIDAVNAENIPEKLTPLQNLWIGLKKLFSAAKDLLSFLSVPFKKIATFLSDLFSGLSNSALSTNADKAANNAEQTEKKVNPIITFLSNIIEGFRNFFEKAAPAFEKIGEWIKDVLTKFGDSIGRFAENHDAGEIIQSILKSGIFIGIIKLIKAIRDVVKGIGGISGSIRRMFNKIGNVFDSLSGLVDQYKKKLKLDAFRSIAVSILIIAISLLVVAGAFALFANIKFENTSVGIIAAILGGFVVITALIAFAANKFLKDKGSTKAVILMALFMAAVSVILLNVAKAFKKFAAIKFDNASVETIAIIFGAFIVLATIIAYAATKFLKQAGSLKALAFMSGFMKTVATSLVVLAASFWVMSKVQYDNDGLIISGIIFGAFLVLTTLVAYVATIFLKEKDSQKALSFMSGFMIIVAFVLLIVAEAFKKMSGLGLESKEMQNIAAIFEAFIVVVALVGIISGKVFESEDNLLGIIAIAGLMLITAISLAIVAGAFSEMASKLSPDKVDMIIDFMISFAVIVALLAAVATGLAATGYGDLGMFLLAVIILAIGAACLMAGAGVAMMASALTDLITSITSLMEAVDKYGDEFIEKIDKTLNALLDMIIGNAPKLLQAAVVIISTFAKGIIISAPIIGRALIELLKYVLQHIDESTQETIPIIAAFIINTINTLGNVLRDSAPLLAKAIRNLFEAVLEASLLALASFLEPWGGLGEALAEKITGAIPGLRKAFKVGEHEADSLLSHIETAGSTKHGGTSGKFDSTDSAASSGKSTMQEFMDAAKTVIGSNDYTDVTPESIMQGIFPSDSDAKESGTSLLSSYAEGLDNYDIDSLKDKYKGVIDFDAISTSSVDESQIKDFFSGKMGDVSAAIEAETPNTQKAAANMAKSIEEPITSLDTKKWGSDVIENFIAGMQEKAPLLRQNTATIALIIQSILGFSEPKEGPLSDFHTYAPDMVKLWCSGVKDNLHLVDKSSTSMASRIKDGLSTALDYVSGLIDGGMTDELTIRPIMDLSEIQNGVQLLDSMLGNNNYPLYGTSRIASYTARNIEDSKNVSAPITPVEQTPQVGATYNNTFNISSNDPDAVADRVSRILQNQTEREKAVWARR